MNKHAATLKSIRTYKANKAMYQKKDRTGILELLQYCKKNIAFLKYEISIQDNPEIIADCKHDLKIELHLYKELKKELKTI